MAFKKWLEQKQNIILYRSAGEIMQSGGFWTTDPDYIKHVMGRGNIYRAELPVSARIKRINTQANKKDISLARTEGYDAVVFPAWDWHTDEYVVLNPKVLLNLCQRPT